MNGDKFIAAIDNLQNKNRLLLAALFIMLCFNIMNWWSLQHAKNQMQTVIVPIGGGVGMTVGNGKASPEYLRQMARYVTGMIGSYTAGTARHQLQELLTLFPPEIVGRAQVEFERLAEQIERYPSISSVIRWAGEDSLKASPTILQVRVAKDRLVNGNVSETKSTYYCVHYRVDSSRFWVLGVQEKESDGVDLCFIDGDARQASKDSPENAGVKDVRTL